MRCFVLIFLLVACSNPQKKSAVTQVSRTIDSNTSESIQPVPKTKIDTIQIFQKIKTGQTTPAELVAFAKTLEHIPYKYASTDPMQGFDCSGFITYVFNHFNIAVPRVSADFTDVGNEVPLKLAKEGDIILFTGTDSSIRTVGHMGIITSNVNNQVSFIHSTSGKANAVTITPLNKYYMGRFVKVNRIFPQNF